MRESTASRAADLAVGVVGAQQRLPRSFLSPVPVLPTAANPNRRGSLCADHSPVVFLLCHNSNLILVNRALQQGHRGKLLASAAANRMRMVAMEFGMCRSGREGGSRGLVIFANGRLRDERGATSFRGGNRLPLGDQEPVSGNA